MEQFNPPSDLKTEKAVLGLTIIHPDLVNLLLEKINSKDFYDLRNEIVFRAIVSLNQDNIPIDFTTLINKIDSMGQLDNIGGNSYLTSLVDEQYYSANYEAYLDIIKEKSVLRQLLSYGDNIINEVRTGKHSSEELIGNFSEKLFKMSEFDNKDGLVKVEDIVSETFAYIAEIALNDGSLTGVTTGFRDLDTQLSGLQNSDFILLAARPSVGKTALGIHMGLNAALAGKKVAVFSLEMSKRQILQRIISILSKVELQDIIAGNIEEQDWALLYNTTETLNNLDLYIDDTASISLTELRAKSKRLKLESGLDLIVIDYLQLMTSEVGRNENRQQEISNISRGLKALAKELNIPVLALSQLSRKSEERTNKRPMLSDLRESGAIEQDADVVMMLYRDDYYDEDAEEQNIIEINVAKHRNGPTGTRKLFFKKENTAFYDLGYDYDQPE